MQLFLLSSSKVKLRHSEKATKFEKNSPTCFDVTVYLNVKTSGRFFSNFVAFSENLNFTKVKLEIRSLKIGHEKTKGKSTHDSRF